MNICMPHTFQTTNSSWNNASTIINIIDKQSKLKTILDNEGEKLHTLGGSRLSKTRSVWEIKFEKRGPIATYSSNL